MIPRICANCEWCELLMAEVDRPMPADCHALPVAVRIDDARAHVPCTFFEMCSQPRVEMADQGQAAPGVQEPGAVEEAGPEEDSEGAEDEGR